MALAGIHRVGLRHGVDGLGLRSWNRYVWVMVLLGVSIWLRHGVDGLGLGSWDRHVWIMVLADRLGLVADFIWRRWLCDRLRLVEVGVLLWLLVGLLLWCRLLVGLLLLLSRLMV